MPPAPRPLPIAIAAVLGASLACQSPRAPAADTATGGAPAGAPAADAGAGGGTPEDLTFAGAVSGHLTRGRKGDVYFCGKLGPRFVADPIEGEIDGTPYDFSITIGDGDEGPGTHTSAKELTPGSGYAAVTVGLAHPGSGTKDWASRPGAGSVTVNADQRSGTVNSDLAPTGKATGAAHVTGTWRCPPD